MKLYTFFVILVTSVAVSNSITQVAPLLGSQWIIGLKEAAYKALKKENFRDDSLHEKLQSAPFYKSKTAAVAKNNQNKVEEWLQGSLNQIYQTGMLFITPTNYEFVLNSFIQECKECFLNVSCSQDCQQWTKRDLFRKPVLFWRIEKFESQLKYTMIPAPQIELFDKNLYRNQKRHVFYLRKKDRRLMDIQNQWVLLDQSFINSDNKINTYASSSTNLHPNDVHSPTTKEPSSTSKSYFYHYYYYLPISEKVIQTLIQSNLTDHKLSKPNENLNSNSYVHSYSSINSNNNNNNNNNLQHAQHNNDVSNSNYENIRPVYENNVEDDSEEDKYSIFDRMLLEKKKIALKSDVNFNDMIDSHSSSTNKHYEFEKVAVVAPAILDKSKQNETESITNRTVSSNIDVNMDILKVTTERSNFSASNSSSNEIFEITTDYKLSKLKNGKSLEQVRKHMTF